MKRIQGVIPPICTPLNEHECVDEKALRNLIEFCIDKIFHGAFICGTNGECMALTQQERDKAIKIALDESSGRIRILAGCMDSSTKRVIENIKRMEQMGGDMAVVTPVFYSRNSSPQETIDHFEKISRNTTADIFIYNIPPFTGYRIPPESVFEIAKFDHIVGYKDTGGQFVEFQRCLDHFRGTDFMVFQGMIGLAAASVLLGADGFIPNAGPVVPEICLKIYEYGKKGDIQKAMTYQSLLSEVLKSFSVCDNAVSACKAAYSLRGLMEQKMCSPAIPVTAQQREHIAEVLMNIDKKQSQLGY